MEKELPIDNVALEFSGVECLAKLFNKFWLKEKWKVSGENHCGTMICKDKWDIRNLGNYTGIELMIHTLKLWEKEKERTHQFQFVSSRLGYQFWIYFHLDTDIRYRRRYE